MSDVEERFSGALHNTSRAWRQALDRRLKYLGVSQASWMTIAVAAKARSPLSQSELADKLAVEGATMVAMVDRLVKAGLVIREPSTTDRRIKRVVLTEAVVIAHNFKPPRGPVKNLSAKPRLAVRPGIGLPAVDEPRFDLQLGRRKPLQTHTIEEPWSIRRNE